MIKYELEGLNTVLGNIDKITAEQTRRANNLIEAVARQVELDAKSITPVHSGRLYNSIRIYPQITKSLHEYFVGSNVSYAKRVHDLDKTRTGEPRFLWKALTKNQSKFFNGLKHIFK